MKTLRTTGSGGRRGLAIVTVTVLLLVVMTLLGVLFRGLSSAHREHLQYRDGLRALYVAEAGLGEALLDFELGGSGALGSAEDPRSFGTAAFWVDVEDLGLRVTALRSTGIDGTSRERLELVVRTVPDGDFQYAAFGKEGVALSPSAFVDSYDSSLGSYDSQYESSAGHAGEHGNVGSDGDIVLLTNSEIWGNATPGPDREVVFAGPNATVSGTTQAAEEPLVFPPITVPMIPSEGQLNPNRGQPLVLTGDHHFQGVLVRPGAGIHVQGPARIVIDDLHLRSNSELVLDTTTGPVEIYCTGNVVLDSNSDLSTVTDRPRDASLLITSNNVDGTPPDVVELGSNSTFTGVIYAPDAHLNFTARFEVFGSVVARRVTMTANSAIHYDISLLFDDDPGNDVLETVSWRPIAEN